MKKLDDVSTRQLLETLKRRGSLGLQISTAAGDQGGIADHSHLESDAGHLLKCLSAEVLDYPYQVQS